MPLTDAKVRSLKPAAKPYKKHDSAGLFMLVTPSGGRLWRFKYDHAGKEQLLSFGKYPDTGLKEARERRDDARKLLSAGKNPSTERKRAAAIAEITSANTFSAVAEELIAKNKAEGRAEATLTKAEWFLSLLKPLADRPIAEIEPYELLAVLKKLEKKGHHETANRALSFAGRVFRYAVATTRAPRNPAADLKGALVAPTVTHHAAILDPKGLGELLRAIDGFVGEPCTKLALRLAPHVFVRPGELRAAEWTEFDFDKQLWVIPAPRTKMRRFEHIVPLSRQVLEILDEAKALTGDGRYVFPGVRTARRPLSENTLNAALRRLGYTNDQMTAHGFRSTASTLLNESGKWSPDAVERALSHKAEGVRGVYNRGQYWQERVDMARWWSDYLDTLRQGAIVIPMRFKGDP